MFRPKELDKVRLDDLAALGFQARQPFGPICFAPPAVAAGDITHDRALFVHDRATLDAKDFSLKRTLTKLAADATAAGAAGATAEALFVALWDTQNTRAEAATPAGAHCDDNNSTLNGFPNACRPVDGGQAKAGNIAAEIAKYRPIGVVNRIDLAAEGWKNCGEHRIVYGRTDGGSKKSFIIFEAVLPNPRPGCASGCRPVAEHWQSLSKENDATKRAEKLEQLFYTKIPNTSLREVVHVAHYAAKPAKSSGYGGAGSGQIRTNQFLKGFDPAAQQPWMLKEFKLAVDCSAGPGQCVFDAIPIPVKVNPHGELWAAATGLANDFQQQVVLPQVDDLAKSLDTFSYQVPVVYDAARSQSQGPPTADHYGNAYQGASAAFKTALAAAATTHGLTDKQIVNRAMALSCGGCHQPSAFGLTQDNSLGPNLKWPESAPAGFVHVDVIENNGKFPLSVALTESFLPARAKNLAAVLSDDVCLCRFRVPGVPPNILDKLERDVSPAPPTSTRDLAQREKQLKQRIDAERSKTNQPALPDLEAQEAPVIVLEEVRSETDPVKRAAARARAVQKLVRDEPPRKTVTGHFRAH